MTRQMEINLLTIFDESINKAKAIRDISKTFQISKEEVIEVLECNDREVPKGKRGPAKKREPEAADPEAERAEVTKEKTLPVCNYVYEVLAEKMDSLEMQLRDLKQKEQEILAKYNTIAAFIKENSL